VSEAGGPALFPAGETRVERSRFFNPKRETRNVFAQYAGSGMGLRTISERAASLARRLAI
jgi:hypothetical protein